MRSGSFVRCLARLACVMCMPFASLRAQDGGALFAGVVQVDDSARRPISGAEISLPGLGFTVHADERGRFRFGVPAGVFRVVVRAVGYLPVDMQFVFADNDTTVKRFLLSAVKMLDSMRITAAAPRIPDFEARRRRGIGHFVGREQLARDEARLLSDALSTIPGLRIVRMGGSHAYAFNPRSRCWAQVYLDGTLVYNAGTKPGFDLNTMTPGSIEAIEYYASGAEAPPQYNMTGSECGVLLIWTRVGL